VSVSHFEDETIRDRSISWKGDWVLVAANHCFQVVSSAIVFLEPFSLFWENFEELSVANYWDLFKVSYHVFRNCSVELFMIGFLSFLSKINCTTLPCVFFVISFRCCWVEFRRRHRYDACLLTLANISRLGFCLVQIALKLIRFLFLKVVLRSKKTFPFFFRFWKRVRLTTNWQNFELWVLSEGCLFWV